MACVPACVVCSTRPGSSSRSSSSSSTRQLAILTPLGLFCFGETHDPGTRCWCFFPQVLQSHQASPEPAKVKLGWAEAADVHTESGIGSRTARGRSAWEQR